MDDANLAGKMPLNQFLRIAVMAGVENAVQIHIRRGDDLNARDASGKTPLMLCAARDKPSICRLLVAAGADLDLRDRTGKTAFDIAIEVGSHATAAILRAAQEAFSESLLTGDKVARDSGVPSDFPVEQIFIAEKSAKQDQYSHAASVPASELTGVPACELAHLSDGVDHQFDDGVFDLSGWEAEEEPSRPDVDRAVLDSASAVQSVITAHQPIDSSSEWEDVEAFLPDLALPLARAGDIEGRGRLRCLLLRALREGSVPALDVQALSTNDDRSANPQAESYLAMVINDLGAEVDERFEYSGADESFKVYVDPVETPEEENAVDAALGAIDRAASPRHEPLRIYQRDFQRWRLLTAEEEVQLGKEMEAALDAALDALAAWPEGIARTLEAGEAAIASARPLSSIWIGGEPEVEPGVPDSLESEAVHVDVEEAPDEHMESSARPSVEASKLAFAELLRQLSVLVDRGNGSRAEFLEIRQALANLRLNRRFLLELIDESQGPKPCPAFALAMAEFRKARDRMTAANLKLAFFHAKKYLYSGEPLDDLAQEGNIGLLKAVDRYDWRLGFRFSTYATWWVRQQISRYVVDKTRTIRLPSHIVEKLQRAERIAHAFEAATRREPTLVELADQLEMPSYKLAALLSIAPEPSRIEDDFLDETIAIDARDSYVSLDPADIVDKVRLSRAVDRYVSSLSTKSRKEEHVVRMRFGFGVNDSLTLDEIGARFGVTRERIRQIEAKALRKLRHPDRSESFSRKALGLQPEESTLAHSFPVPEEEQVRSAVDLIGQPVGSTGQGVSLSLTEPERPDSSSKASAMDLLLANAVELGIPVTDERHLAGSVWVELLEPRDNRHHRLVRKLLDIGFTFRPGRGYWK